MKVRETALSGVRVIEPTIHRDARGFFLETFHAERYAEAGIPGPFVQDNVSYSGRGVLRGLHLQVGTPQAKLVSVTRGEVFDVAADVRTGSPTFGRWVGETLSDENLHQLFIPAGFAHGFVVIREPAVLLYKCSDRYVPGDELTLRWDDPDLGIDWPVDEPIVSEKDAAGLRLAEIEPDRLPRYAPKV